MKYCPHPQCRQSIAPHQFACSRHWTSIDAVVRAKVTAAYWAFKDNECSFADVVAAERDACLELGWRENRLAGCTDRLMQSAVCPKCGRTFLCCPKEDGTVILLEEIDDYQTGGTLLVMNRLYFVIGFIAYHANGIRGAYTPFGEHICRLATRLPVPHPAPLASKIFTPSV